ncbi:hypothetical protein HGB13_01900 [bacterium]|nr:hypothetical protein [bacterium]
MENKKILVIYTDGLVIMPDGASYSTILIGDGKDEGADLVEIIGEPEEVLDNRGSKHMLYTTVDGEKLITN